MFKAITSLLFIIAFIFITAGAAEPEQFCGKAITGQVPSSYTGVYSGYLDTFGVCALDTTQATVYFNFDKGPVIIVYDGCVLEDYSYAGEVVYYTGNNSQVELGRFDTKSGKDGFIYKRMLNHFYADNPKDYKPFFWTKTGELDDNIKAYNDYLEDYKKFKDYWSGFETAFFKKDFDKCAELTNFPLMNRTVDPPVKLEKKDFKAFITKVFNDAAERTSTTGVYKTHDWFPQRFGDHDPCFAKSYTWSYTSPRFNFTKISGEYKLTNLYEYE